MKKLILLFTLSVTAHAFDIAQIDWSKVTSQVRWLNLTTEPSLLTLAIDDFEALKKLKSGSIYPHTKFPTGSYRANILDYQKNTWDSFILNIKYSKKYTIVTMGTKPNILNLVIEETETPTKKGFSRVRLFNACPGTIIEWKTSIEKELKRIEFGKSGELEFSTNEPPNIFPLIEGTNIRKRELRLPIKQERDSNFLVFVHLNETDDATPEITLINEGSSE